jgi:membrane fusion protein, multidrug efflux system
MSIHSSRIAAIAAASFIATACGGGPAKKGPPSTPVRVAAVTRIDAPVNILASGVVEPLQSVAVTAQVSGSLLDVAFKEGEVVQKGQVLFHIDPRPLQAAVDQVRANLARDEAQALAGSKDDERYRRLADMGYVSRSQADQMHATAAAQAATVAADRAALRATQVNLGFATIRAPISGHTGSLLVRQGNNVSPGSTALVVINQISPVLVRFPVLSQDFDALQQAVESHGVEVRAASGDSAQTNELGTLDFLDNAIDSLTGTVTGKARFANVGNRLWPGELVFLTVQLNVQRGVLAVPSVAVQNGQQGTFVYVVDQKNTARTRVVATGIQVGDLTVVDKGLNLGERVVTDGQSRLNPGSRVAVIGPGGDTSRARLGSAGSSGDGGVAAGEVSSANEASTNGATARGGNAAGPRGTTAPNLPPPIVRAPSTANTTSPVTTPPATSTTTTPPRAATPPVVTPPTSAGSRPPERQ